MRSLTLLSTAVALAGARSAIAQEIRWINPLGGSWNLASSWENGEIPDSPFEIARIDAPGTYNIEFDRSTLLLGMRVVNPNAVVNMRAGDSMYILTENATASGSPFAINGVLNVNATAENRPTAISICDSYPYGDADVNATGTGIIRLNAHPDNLDSARIDNFCTVGSLYVGAQQTVAGTGRIFVNVTNRGVIAADVPGRALELRGLSYPGLTNQGEFRALNGGILRFQSPLYASAYSPNARVVIDSTSIVEWDGNGASRGIIDNSAGGESVIRGLCSFYDVTLLGSHHLAGGSSLWIDGVITNHGELVVRGDDAAASTLYAGYSDSTIAGTGTVYLNGSTDLPTLARISTTNLYAVLRFGSEQALAGTGQVGVDVLNEGTLSPGGLGDPIGLIELQSTNWTQAVGSQMVIDVAGTGAEQHDRTTRVGHLTLGGSLIVRLTNGFQPHAGDEFVIATHLSRSGAFDAIQGPVVGSLGWRVRYDTNATILTMSCVTDLDGDGLTNLVDLAMLLSNYGGSGVGVIGDLNGDGSVGLQDLASLLSAFGGSCE